MPDPWSSSNPQSAPPAPPAAPTPAQPAVPTPPLPSSQPAPSGQPGGPSPFVPSPVPPPPGAGQAPVLAPAKPLPVPQPGPATTSSPAAAPPLPAVPLPLDIGSLSLRSSTEIQGNVLAGFRKDHQVFTFLKLPDSSAQAQGWLKELVPRIAATQEVAAFNRRFSEARRQNGGDDPENLQSKWVNVGFTAGGLQRFGLPQIAADLSPTGSFPEFVAGAASSASRLGDTGTHNDPSKWLIGGPNQLSVDAILTVAADDPNDLLVEMEKLRALATKYGVVTLFEQRGNTLPDDRAGHEHFGFKDGISQPGVRGFDKPGLSASSSIDRDHSNEMADSAGSSLVSAGEFVLGYPREGGQGALQCSEWLKNGSFQVWRRLRQDVPGYWAQMTQLQAAPALPNNPMTEDGLAAKLMGRWRSGTPLDGAPTEDNRSAHDPKDDNDFNFSGRTDDGKISAPGTPLMTDTTGGRCPLDSHIRKMNPRNGEEALHRIIRRGIPFGLPFDPSAGRGQGVDADRGLIFMAFMANIGQQFEFLQEAWANSTFPGSGAGCDPVIGAPIVGTPTGNQPTHTIPQSAGAGVPLVLQRFVHTTGAVYAFAPSIKTLNALANGTF